MSTFRTKIGNDLVAVPQNNVSTLKKVLTKDYEVDTAYWPRNQIVTIVFIQDGVGGHSVTHNGKNIEINSKANSASVTTWVNNGGIWKGVGFDTSLIPSPIVYPIDLSDMIVVSYHDGINFFNEPPLETPNSVSITEDGIITESYSGSDTYEVYSIPSMSGKMRSDLGHFTFNMTSANIYNPTNDEWYVVLLSVWLSSNNEYIMEPSVEMSINGSFIMEEETVAPNDSTFVGIIFNIYKGDPDITIEWKLPEALLLDENYNAISSKINNVEGTRTIASGYASHAEGFYASASGVFSHAEGGHTSASGGFSHAEGYYTSAIGEASHAEGYRTIARSKYESIRGTRGTNHSIVPSGQVETWGYGSTTMNLDLLVPKGLSRIKATVSCWNPVAAIGAVWEVEAIVGVTGDTTWTPRIVGTPTITKIAGDTGSETWSLATSVISGDIDTAKFRITGSNGSSDTRWGSIFERISLVND